MGLHLDPHETGGGGENIGGALAVRVHEVNLLVLMTLGRRFNVS